jgi:type 1 glutamine amidotransferase
VVAWSDRRRRHTALATLILAFVVVAPGRSGAGNQSGYSPAPARKHVLAWADVRNGYQHDSISHAVATIERLGWESGLYDTFIRTDSQLITRQPVAFPQNLGIATGESPLARNLNYFDALFFFGVREIELTAQQRSDLLAFIKDDGKGFVAAHSAITGFFSWPEFGDMIGGRFDEHPWNIVEARVVVDDRAFPATRHLPPSFVIQDEHYQIKDFSRGKMRILARLDPGSVDLTKPLVHRTDGDFPIAWAKDYGKGRVFYSTLGHDAETWDNPMVRTMYFEAIKWALGLVPGATAPIPKP